MEPMATTLNPNSRKQNNLTLVLVFLSLVAKSSAATKLECKEGQHGECYNPPEALRLKLIAIAVILVASMIGVCLPLFSRSIPTLRPDRNLFMVVRAFSSGVILATGFMHVLPDSFDKLTSACLPENPWHHFPFTTFIAMISAVLTLMVNSFTTTFKNQKVAAAADGNDNVPLPVINGDVRPLPPASSTENSVLHQRIMAKILELGIVVHSVIIGLSVGASEDPCTIKPLVAAVCFHQLFEGMGLGGCILQAEFSLKTRSILVFFFSITTPFGVALGIGLTKVYTENSTTESIAVGVLNATSAGLLIYMALVELLAADFMGPKLQSNARLQGWSYLAVFLGMGGMSVLAKWA